MSVIFTPGQFPEPVQYTRGGKNVLLDLCRQKLVPAAPEEIIRQKFLLFLTEGMEVPLACISTEEPLCHFRRGARGRADVVVWTSEKQDTPLLVAECKAPTVPLTDAVLEQVTRYHNVIRGEAGVVATTNGHQTAWYQVDEATGASVKLKSAPTFKALLGGNVPPPASVPPPPKRPHFKSPSPSDYALLYGEDLLGEGSPNKNHGYLGNLIGLLYLAGEPLYKGRPGLFTIRETGIRHASFGNAAGGQWTGPYRYFLLDDAAGDAQLVSIAVLGKMLVRNHSKHGNTSGTTMLIVAVDDYEKSHNSLQLDLDKYVRRSGRALTVWHDGTLTKGKQGRLKRSVVIDFVRSHAPNLIGGGEVRLGELPANAWMTWEAAEAFIYNCIQYALVRDDLRRTP